MADPLFIGTAIAAGLLAVIVAVWLFQENEKADEGSERMREVSSYIENGAYSFIKRQYKLLTAFTLVLAVIIAIVFEWPYSVPIAVSYIIGSLASMIAGYLGIIVATRANRRTAAAANKGGLNAAFKVAFRAGSFMGLCIAGLALIGLGILYMVWEFVFPVAGTPKLWEIVVGFSFGASTVALFAKAGGGIYTKTADIAADIVGKIEHHIPEDDPRNPAAVADAVGDNVGDVAGSGADIFDSNVAAILGAAILGASIDAVTPTTISFGLLPLMLAGIGTIASVVGVFLVQPKKGEDPGPALNRGTYLTTILFAVLATLVIYLLGANLVLALSAILGLLGGVVIGFTSDVFTSDRGLGSFKPVLNMVDAADESPASLILSGYSYGLLSAVPSVLGVVAAMVLSFILGANATTPGLGGWPGGIYAVAIAAVGLLSTNGFIMSTDAYGPIVDNARGVIEQAQAPHEAVVACDKLDASGNTTKAITKGFAIGASAISVLALFSAFIETAGIGRVVNIADPFILAGAFIGSLIPPVFSAILILGVQENSGRVIREIRRQFDEDPGILEGTSKPDYDACIGIATTGAIKELMPGTILSIGVTILTGAILGLQALAAYLGGAVIIGFILALLMDNSGGAWDNTKKIIESPEYDKYEKGSEEWYQVAEAAVLGDMIGDPFKDTAGPSINTLLVVLSLTATLFLPIIVILNNLIFP
ncbi:MAG: sodium-translocating pyrophosphatase [Promethearchaeia archaeon]